MKKPKISEREECQLELGKTMQSGLWKKIVWSKQITDNLGKLMILRGNTSSFSKKDYSITTRISL